LKSNIKGVILALQNLKELRRGESIIQDLSYLERPLVIRTRGKHAMFENSCLTIAEIENRLKKCGLDGLLLKAYLALEESVEVLSRATGLSVEETDRGIATALKYISNKWPKDDNYGIYKSRKRWSIGTVIHHT